MGSVIIHFELKLVAFALFLSTPRFPTDQKFYSSPPDVAPVNLRFMLYCHGGRPLTSEPPESTEALVSLAFDSGEIDA
jgi:hypothetical protein